jgi:HTH-type transcriptional regulator/antitoxin HigA
VLATLIDAYEAEHYPMEPPDPIEAIKFRMEQQGLSRRDLEEIIGTRTRALPRFSTASAGCRSR